MTSDQLSELAKVLDLALSQNDINYAVELFSNEAKYADDLKNNSWDLIPILTRYLTKETNDDDLHECCVSLLNKICEYSNPEDVVLQYIAEIEDTENQEKFLALLGGLHYAINRITKRKTNALAWSSNAIQNFLKKCCVSHYDNTDLEYTDTIPEPLRKIRDLYDHIILYYSKIIRGLSKNSIEISIVCNFLVQLLGRPLCYLPIGQIISTKVIHIIFQIIHNPFVFTEMHHTRVNDELIKPDNLSVANLFYFVFCSSEINLKMIPQVYSLEYIFVTCLYLVTTLLCDENTKLTRKGLKLARYLFEPIKNPNFSYTLLKCEDHSLFCKSIANIIVYNNAIEIRQDALDLFTIYLNLFEPKGIYLIIYNLLAHLSHSGLKGHLIVFYKNLLQTHVSTDKSTNISPLFKGEKLFALIRRFCYLPKNSESNIVDISDQVISTLNFLRYLFIFDKDNRTEIWNFLHTLKAIYIEPLRTATSYTKNQCMLEFRKVEESKQQDTSTDVSVTVEGEELKMAKQDKLQALNASLVTLDVITSLLNRLVELISITNIYLLWQICRKNLCQNVADCTDGVKYEDEIKNKILAASLPFVNEFGWSKECLSKGAEEIGYPGIAHGLFPKSTGDLVHYFNTTSNLKLVEILKQRQINNPDQQLKPPEFVEFAIQERLKMLVPYVNRWPQAIAIMSLPPNVPNALAAVLTMVDDICYYAGDRSVNFNWYVRRVGVAGVYKATELYLLQDTSEDQKYTWEFLKKRMEEAVQIYGLISKSDIASRGAQDVTKSAFVTARNILGVNWNR